MIEELLADLPEIYQPVYGHPELSSQVSRSSVDRLKKIKVIYESLRGLHDRPLKVLDLGCAQGYFTLNLAALGATVHGVDYLDKNIAVCNALANKNPALKVSFETGYVEEAISRLEPDQYDLVLGLSVFHHIVHEKGVDFVKAMLNCIARQCSALVVELALREEPLYWGAAQPEDPRVLFDSIAFAHEIARHGTHLSDITRPLFLVSNRCWMINEQCEFFDSWADEPHPLAQNAHQHSRRYFFSKATIVKKYRFDHPRGEHNRKEYEREINFIKNPPKGFSVAKVIACDESKTEACLAMKRLPGRLLLDLLQQGVDFDRHSVLLSVLRQLSILEADGLYHDDVRTWNVLVAEDGASQLIDYGSISVSASDCVWPHNLFLSFLIFVREVVTGKIDDPFPFRTIAISPFGLPSPYHGWATSLWRRPLSDLSFKLMYTGLKEMPAKIEEKLAIDSVGEWMKAIEEAIEAQKSYSKDILRQAEARSQVQEERAVDAESRAGEQEVRAIAAEALSQAQEARAQAEAERAVVAESRAGEQESRALMAEALAQAEAERALVAESRAGEQESRALIAEALAQAEAERALVAETRAGEQESRALVAEALAQAEAERALVAESRAGEQESRALVAEARAQSKEMRAVTAESRAGEQEDRAVAAETWGQNEQSRALTAEARAQELESRLQQMQQALSGTNAQLEAITHLAHDWHDQILRLQRSISWRVTSPLRFVRKSIVVFLRGIKALFKFILFSVAGLLSLPFLPLLLIFIPYVLARPVLRNRLGQRIRYYPKLRYALRLSAYKLGFILNDPRLEGWPIENQQLGLPAKTSLSSPSPIVEEEGSYVSGQVAISLIQPAEKHGTLPEDYAQKQEGEGRNGKSMPKHPDLSKLTPRARQIYYQLEEVCKNRVKGTG